VPAASRPADDLICADEAAARLAPLNAWAHVALAVSGGADSTALMWLAARAAAAGAVRARLTVLTVDHGLRPGAGDEALAVAGWAEALGLPAVALSWTGPKPETGVQAAAREARYRLMDAWRRANGAGAIVTAHTMDDQAETLLMRLARGSGLHGLAAMRPLQHEPWPILRPLLDVPRVRLLATLEAAGHPWIDDPSNDDPRFERVRLRALRPALAELGLTGARVALAARRLARADAALEEMTAQALRRLVDTDPLGVLSLSADGLMTLPPEVRVRVLQAAIGRAGGHPGPGDLAAAETLEDWIASGAPGVRTLRGARAERRGKALILCREPGRMPGAPQPVDPARPILFDQRFEMDVDGGSLGGPLMVRPVFSLRPRPSRPRTVRAVVWAALPCLARYDGAPVWLPEPGAAAGVVRLRALPPQASPGAIAPFSEG